MKYQYAVGRILDHFPELKLEDVTLRLRQSTFVSLPKRYMYCEVPKAGCTQMKVLMRQVEGAPPIRLFTDGDWVTRREMFIHSRTNIPLPSLADLDDTTQREVLESQEFFRMTVVRNPYSRLVSAWRNNVFLCERTGRKVYLQMKGHLPDIQEKSLVSFSEFVKYIETKCDVCCCDPHWMRQVVYTSFPAMNFSCVARLEELREGLQRFADHVGLSEPLIAAGKNESLPVGTASYCEDLADRVYSLYRPDFDALKYDRDTWKSDRQNATEQSNGTICISERKLIDEVIERNLIILTLYEERDRLRNQLAWVSRLRLQSTIEGLVVVHSISRRAARKIRATVLRMLGHRRSMQKATLSEES
jgi:sulfotransferase famil protein